RRFACGSYCTLIRWVGVKTGGVSVFCFFRAMLINHLGSDCRHPHHRKKSAHTVVLRDNSSGRFPPYKAAQQHQGIWSAFGTGSRHYSEQETAPTPHRCHAIFHRRHTPTPYKGTASLP
ncbi:unnamed protein product, partial [Ectocarpus sp. 8 AP-2014]